MAVNGLSKLVQSAACALYSTAAMRAWRVRRMSCTFQGLALDFFHR